MAINFEDYSWVNDRVEEVEGSLQTYDPNTSIVLNPRWYGVYKIRILPIPPENRSDWARQFAHHWNLVPGDEDARVVVGCPRFTYGKECPVCSAIDRAIAEKKAKIEVFKGGKDGKGNMLAQKKFFVRVLLLDYKNNGEEKKPPKFKDLPQLKVMALGAKIIKGLNLKLKDVDDFGPKALLHPVVGKVIKLTKSEKIDMYWDFDVLDSYPIPKEFLEPAEWPVIADYLPDTTTEEIIQITEKHARNMNPLLVNNILAIEAGPSQKQIPVATKKASTKDLKTALDNI